MSFPKFVNVLKISLFCSLIIVTEESPSIFDGEFHMESCQHPADFAVVRNYSFCVMMENATSSFTRIKFLYLQKALQCLGCWQTDFKQVLEEFNKDQYTIVCWDPPGFGKSRPPDRDFSYGYNARDADKAHRLMKVSFFNCFVLFELFLDS